MGVFEYSNTYDTRVCDFLFYKKTWKFPLIDTGVIDLSVN